PAGRCRPFAGVGPAGLADGCAVEASVADRVGIRRDGLGCGGGRRDCISQRGEAAHGLGAGRAAAEHRRPHDAPDAADEADEQRSERHTMRRGLLAMWLVVGLASAGAVGMTGAQYVSSRARAESARAGANVVADQLRELSAFRVSAAAWTTRTK